jgi:pimeloyl-ACP methyl ester carboxylesterase
MAPVPTEWGSAAHFALEEVVKHEMGGRDDHHEFPALRTERVQLFGIHGFGDELVFPLHGLISFCYGVRIRVDGHDAQHSKSRTVPELRRSASGQGRAAVRIDKRGMFGSDAAVANANAVTIADHVSDTAAWVRRIREETGTPCVWLIGHSEGGLVSLAAAQEVEGLCGLVLVAAPGKPMGEVIRAQLRANPANAT